MHKLYFSQFRDLSHDFPELAPLKCVLSVVLVPRTRSWGESSHARTQSLRGESGDGKSTAGSALRDNEKRVSPHFSPIIMPLEIMAWTPAQLAPFILKLAPHQPVDGMYYCLVCVISEGGEEKAKLFYNLSALAGRCFCLVSIFINER